MTSAPSFDELLSGFKSTEKLEPMLTVANQPFIHRDLSWLQFNNRVLGEARTMSNPVLERLKFLSISFSNLDEFFMIRMASLARAIRNPGNQQIVERLKTIRSTVLKEIYRTVKKQKDTLDLLSTELSQGGIELVYSMKDAEPEVFRLGKTVFEQRIFPNLDPPKEFAWTQFAKAENLRLEVILGEKLWFQIPHQAPRAIKAVQVETAIIGGKRKILLFFTDELLREFLGEKFGLQEPCSVFRVTRDNDLTWDLDLGESTSIPDVVMKKIRGRDPGHAMRLQWHPKTNPGFVRKAAEALKIESDSVIPVPSSLCVYGLMSALQEFPEDFRVKKGFTYPAFKAFVPKSLSAPATIFPALREKDYLLHHPYDSFDAYVNFIRAACSDDAVKEISQTVYRMDSMSPVLQSLKEVARRKKVRVLVELRARFDELNNLKLTQELREAGVEVNFGFGKLKLHAKIALVVRQADAGLEYFSHLSTGNYHSITAKNYTDLALLTSNKEIGEDVAYFFDSVAKGKIPESFKTLIPAPQQLHKKLLSLIQAEIHAAREGKPAYIFAKVNALVDDKMATQLYKASAAGVKVDLVVRGACSLVPGLPGLSEKISVHSIVDRFLEHSRIYHFGVSNVTYLSSADWMPRNFFSRLEVAFPITDFRLQKYIREQMIPAYLADSVKGKVLDREGRWRRPSSRHLTAEFKEGLRAQLYFEKLANKAYQGTPLCLIKE